LCQQAEVGDPFLWTIISNCVGLAGLMLTWVFVGRVGRRTLILIGCLLCTFCMLVMAVLYTVPGLSTHNAGIGLIVTTSVYLFGFNFGLEPCEFILITLPKTERLLTENADVYLVAGELPAQNLRAYTMGLASGVSFIFAWICAFTTPYYINKNELNWGPKYGYIWFVAGLIVSAFVYFMLPEVRGRTLEEIDEMFRNKVPLKDFGKYVCVEIEEARERGLANAQAFGKAELLEDKPVPAHVENATKA
jgi:MFS transporter, SP family, sugar:H+ symporter